MSLFWDSSLYELNSIKIACKCVPLIKPKPIPIVFIWLKEGPLWPTCVHAQGPQLFVCKHLNDTHPRSLSKSILVKCSNLEPYCDRGSLTWMEFSVGGETLLMLPITTVVGVLSSRLSVCRSYHQHNSILLAFYNQELGESKGLKQHTIKVCVSCFRQWPGTPWPMVTYLMPSFYFFKCREQRKRAGWGPFHG